MDYYINLAVEQNARWLAFRSRQENKQKSELAMRQEFFGSRYEINISHSITNGIATHKLYNDKNGTNL